MICEEMVTVIGSASSLGKPHRLRKAGIVLKFLAKGYSALIIAYEKIRTGRIYNVSSHHRTSKHHVPHAYVDFQLGH
jgi:hypothetical protein